MSLKSTCSNCRFGMVVEGKWHCHRAPPSPQIIGDVLHSPWPVVHPASWCGEFKRALARIFKSDGSA